MTVHVSQREFDENAADLIRAAKANGESLVVFENGKPSFEVKPILETEIDPRSDDVRRHDDAILAKLRGSVLFYDRPFDPVGEEDWEALK